MTASAKNDCGMTVCACDAAGICGVEAGVCSGIAVGVCAEFCVDTDGCVDDVDGDGIDTESSAGTAVGVTARDGLQSVLDVCSFIFVSVSVSMLAADPFKRIFCKSVHAS